MPRVLPLEKEEVEALLEKHGSPLQVYDEDGIRSNIKGLFSAFESKFEGFRQFFAVKALPNPVILKLLADEGCGFDCSSAAELLISSELVEPTKIVYTSNYTSKADLELAVRLGVLINLDDVSLVDDLVSVCEAAGLPFPSFLSFRLNPGLGKTDSETKSNVLGGPDAKFGVPPDAIEDAFRKAKEAGATHFGIHMMTGSCVMLSEYWSETIAVLVETMAKLRSALGIEFDFVNVGGGLGIPYRVGQKELVLGPIVDRMHDTIVSATTKHGMPLEAFPRLAMENGRYVTGPFGWLLTRVHVVKRAFGDTYLGVDATMSNLMRPGMYGAFHHIATLAKPLTDADKEAAEAADAGEEAGAAGGGGEEGGGMFHVVGTLCENNDWFGRDRRLPEDTGVGSVVIIYDAGAHAHSMGFQYNAKLRAPEVLVSRSHEPRLIRRRETIGDYFSTIHWDEETFGPKPATLALKPGEVHPKTTRE